MMKYRLRILIAAFSLLAAPAQAETLLIRDVTIVSPERAEPFGPVNVLIRDGRIEDIGAPDGTAADRALEANGLYLTPGLIDGHADLHRAPGMKNARPDLRERLEDAYFAQMPRSYLYFGFTTLIQPDAVRRLGEIAPAADAAPAVRHCAEALVLPDGYGAADYHPGIALSLYDNFLYDHHAGGYLPSRFDKMRHTPQAAVGEVNRRGGRCVMTYYEDAPGDPSALPWELPSRDILRGVATHARRYGLPMLVQTRSLSGYAVALEAGADIIAHGLWYDGLAEPPGERLPPTVQDILDRIASSDKRLMPTLAAADALIGMLDAEMIYDPRLGHALPPDYVSWMRGDGGKTQRQALLDGQPPEIGPVELRRAFEATRRLAADAAAYLAAENAETLIFGTGAIARQGLFQAPGYTGRRELTHWAEAGIPLSEIFAAATLRTAKAFGLENDIGSIETGKRADLLLLGADPRQSIDAYDSIRFVIVGGTVHERGSLSGSLSAGRRR